MQAFSLSNAGWVGALKMVVPVLVLEEDDPRIRYSGQPLYTDYRAFYYYPTSVAYGGALRYYNDVGCFYEVTLPPGYTTAAFGGYVDPNGADFTVYVNAIPVLNGTQYSATVANRTYFALTGLSGDDVVRMVHGPDRGSATSLLANRITLS